MPARRGSGRKRKPANLVILEGNPGRRKVRTEPKPPMDMPPPPSHLDKYALEEWIRVADGMNAMGILSIVDQATLGAYCAAYSRWRHAEEAIRGRVEAAGGNELAGLIDKTSNGNIIQNCLIGIANKAAADMVRYAAEFGLTPAARARLSIDPDRNKGSKFSGLLGLNGGENEPCKG